MIDSFVCYLGIEIKWIDGIVNENDHIIRMKRGYIKERGDGIDSISVSGVS